MTTKRLLAHMKMVMFGCGWKSVWAGDTAAARLSLVATQAVRRGWRLGAPGRLEPTPHLPHVTTRSTIRWAAVLATAVAVATTGCSSAPTTSPGVTGTGNVSLVTAGTLSVCTNLPFKPMEYKDENNAVIGFDMDMMGLVAAQLGVSVTPYEVDFDQITSGAAMLAGKCDIAASSITITDARAQAVNFSAPYFSATQALAVAADSGIKGLADMSGKKVAVETDTTGADYANEHATEYGYQVVIFDDGGTALNSILSGRADACLIDRAIVYGFVDDNPSTTVATEFQTGELYGFAAAKSDAGAALIALVNQVLTTSNSDGTYLNLYKKWIDANATSAKLP